MIDLSDEIPPGLVEITVRSVVNGGKKTKGKKHSMTREEAKAMLIAAGLVDPDSEYASPDAVELSEEEAGRLGRLFAGDRPLSELIDEDREERI